MKGYTVDDELAPTLLVFWEDVTEGLALELPKDCELAADPGRAM